MTLISNAVLPSFIFKCICILRKKLLSIFSVKARSKMQVFRRSGYETINGTFYQLIDFFSPYD